VQHNKSLWQIAHNLIHQEPYKYMKKFLSFLGTVVRIIGQASGFVPLVNQVVPSKDAPEVQNIEDKLSKIFGVVITAEQMFTAAYGVDSKKGSDKLKATTPFVAQLVQAAPILAGKKIENEQLFEDACTRLTAAAADILNSLGH
jgi:hypothetical protein